MLNDEAKEAGRQQLLPYVTRLACADTDEIEEQRQIFIWSRVGPFTPLKRGIEILEGALAIGRQADPLESPVVVLFNNLRDFPRTASPKAGSSVLAQLKSYLDAMAL